MQSPSLVSVDMMSAGPPPSASTTKTGQDGVFAAHLAAASQQGQATPASQTKTSGKQESNPAPAEKTTDAGAPASAQQTEASNTKEADTSSDGDNTKAQQQEALNIKDAKTSSAGNTTHKENTSDALLAGASLNSSAGAATIGIFPAQWPDAAGGSASSQNSAKAVNSESAVSQMLNTITAASGGSMAAPPTNSAITQTKEDATALATTAKTATPALTIEPQQPLLTTNPSIAAPETIGNTSPNTSPDGINGITQVENTVPQPLTPVAFAPADTPQAAATTTAKTEQPATAAPSATNQPPAATAQTVAQQNSAQQGADQIIQNQYGQIITIYQSSESEELTATTTADSKPLTTVTYNQSLDGSKPHTATLLPDAIAKAIEKDNSNQQQDTTAKDNQQKGTNTTKTVANVTTQPDQVASQTFQASVGTENQSLVFSHQQTSTSLTAAAPVANSSSLQLPSGVTVPGGTVVDQMITHLSMNNRLESGIVNIKLHPQELGELRMEIKITQDNIKAHITAQSPQAQDMINQHLPRLREALEQQGLHLQQIDVTFAANDNASREQFQNHTGQQQLNQSSHNRGSQPIFSLDTDDESEVTAQANLLSVLA